MNTDKLTTILGAAVGTMQAASVAAGQMAPGTSLHTQDYISLAMAVLFSIVGFFTNKTAKQ